MLSTARLRLSLVVLLSAMFWVSLYGIFVEAFTFLEALHAEVISLLFNAFFSSLMVMLVFSTGILLYGGMYCSPESRLLMTLPAREEAIFSHKFQEAVWFSSWGFILLGSPMLVAYGVVRDSPWTYFALLLPFMIAFVVIPATVGGICCMAMVAWLPRLRLHALSIALATACVATLWLAWSTLSSVRADSMSAAWFEQTFSRLAITEQKLFPSWWLSSGLLESARRGNTRGEAWAAFAEAGVRRHRESESAIQPAAWRQGQRPRTREGSSRLSHRVAAVDASYQHFRRTVPHLMMLDARHAAPSFPRSTAPATPANPAAPAAP
jgi:ABC-2 type transport system permease protein